jgi:hypothetical protein
MTDTNKFTLPHDPLTPLDPTAKPNAHTILLLCEQLYANAQAVPSKLGGGANGHLGMMMPTAEYILFSAGGAPYVHPVDPVEPPAAATVKAQLALDKTYTAAQKAYTEKLQLQEQLKKLILQAVPPLYINSLKHITLGFTMVKPWTILNHLVAAFGQITPDILATNLELIQAPWDTATQIQVVFTTADACRKIATRGEDPISDTSYMRFLLATFKASGVLDDAVKAWTLQRALPKTVANFTEHFTAAEDYWRSNRATTTDDLAANQVLPATLPPPPAGLPRPAPNPEPSTTREGWHYCWTHGVAAHPGLLCRSPAPGHSNAATLSDRQGGSESINIHRHHRHSQSHAARRARGRGRGRGRGGRGAPPPGAP